MRSPFLRRRVNGNRRWDDPSPERFIDRLCYAAGPSAFRLDRRIFRGGTVEDNAGLRNRWARSHRRRRVRQDRRRVTGFVHKGTLPVPPRVKHRYDAWGGA